MPPGGEARRAQPLPSRWFRVDKECPDSRLAAVERQALGGIAEVGRLDATIQRGLADIVRGASVRG